MFSLPTLILLSCAGIIAALFGSYALNQASRDESFIALLTFFTTTALALASPAAVLVAFVTAVFSLTGGL